MPQYFTNSPSVDTIEADPPGLVGARFNGVLRAATDTITIPASTSAGSMFGIVPIMSSALIVAIQYSWTALGGTDWGHDKGGRICINKPRPEPVSLNPTYEIPYTTAAGLNVDGVLGTLAWGVNCEFEGDSGVIKDFGRQAKFPQDTSQRLLHRVPSPSVRHACACGWEGGVSCTGSAFRLCPRFRIIAQLRATGDREDLSHGGP